MIVLDQRSEQTIVTELQDTQRCYNLHENSANGHIMSILENNFITINFVISNHIKKYLIST